MIIVFFCFGVVVVLGGVCEEALELQMGGEGIKTWNSLS